MFLVESPYSKSSRSESCIGDGSPDPQLRHPNEQRMPPTSTFESCATSSAARYRAQRQVPAAERLETLRRDVARVCEAKAAAARANGHSEGVREKYETLLERPQVRPALWMNIESMRAPSLSEPTWDPEIATSSLMSHSSRQVRAPGSICQGHAFQGSRDVQTPLCNANCDRDIVPCKMWRTTLATCCEALYSSYTGLTRNCQTCSVGEGQHSNKPRSGEQSVDRQHVSHGTRNPLISPC